MENETMGNQQATQAEVGWLAGIIDGEGHLGISLSKAKNPAVRCDLQIVNTDFELIDRLVDVLRRIGVNPYVRDRVHDKQRWATNRIVSISRMKHIKMVLETTMDHLTGLRREKAKLMLALIESRILKTRGDKYDAHENGIILEFRERFVGRCGASTTAREARVTWRREDTVCSHGKP